MRRERLMVVLAAALLAAGAAAPPAPAPTPTPPATGMLGLGGGTGPVEITSTNGVELHQPEKAYVAHGNVVVKRGDRTLYGDTVTAYYRDVPNSSQTEIWRVVAEGHVRLTTPQDEVVGDKGVYDLDTKIVVLTGNGLKLTTPSDVVTARDSLEWYDDKQLAVARGNALGVRADRRIRADILTSKIVNEPGKPQRIARMDAHGHVIVSRPGEISTGDDGVYNVDTGQVTMTGHVLLSRGDSSMAGRSGVVDLNNNVTRLLPREPGGSGGPDGRVQAYIVPVKHDPPSGTAPTVAAPSGAAPTGTAPSAPASPGGKTP